MTAARTSDGDLAARVRQLEEACAATRRELAVQFKRMAQMQAQIDETAAQLHAIRNAWEGLKRRRKR